MNRNSAITRRAYAVFFIAASICLPFAARAADFSVTVFTDTAANATIVGAGDGVGTPGDLRSAILAANAASGSSTITFSGSPPHTIILGGPLPPISCNLTIDGGAYGNVIIDGASQFRVFFVNSGTVTLKNLLIQHARAKGGDGAGGGAGLGAGLFINQRTAVVNLADVFFANCDAIGGGGGLSSGGGGLGFNGGAPSSVKGFDNGGGGGGIQGPGGNAFLGGGGSGGVGGGGGGGSNIELGGPEGSSYSIGNATGSSGNAVNSNGGNGGFGGGGGGAFAGNGGAGGFGGGGGVSAGGGYGGNGGAGGGGGGGTPAGGGGMLTALVGGGSSGGGGAAAGPAIFVLAGTLNTSNCGADPTTNTNMAGPGSGGGSNGKADLTNAAVFNYEGIVNGSGTAGPVPSTLGAIAPFTIQPTSQTMAVGSTVAFNAAVGVSATYQWQFDGANILGATGSRLVVSGATAANAGTYTCLASTATGSINSDSATLTVISTTNSGRLINLSALSQAGKSQILTVGFVTGGSGTSGSQSLLIRATGPALTAFGVPNFLADPNLTVLSGQTVAASNDNWGTPAGNQALVTAADSATLAFPLTNPSSLDSALVTSLPTVSGGYTVQVSGNSATSGTALAEVYDDTPAGNYTSATPRLINLSANNQLVTNGSLTAGFVIGGATGKTVLIRATGPALAALGVSGAIPDPQIALHSTVDGQDMVLASNAGWGGDPGITAEDTAVGAFALTNPASKDSALLVTLAPGAYTAVASSVSGLGGVALVEVYEVP